MAFNPNDIALVQTISSDGFQSLTAADAAAAAANASLTIGKSWTLAADFSFTCRSIINGGGLIVCAGHTLTVPANVQCDRLKQFFDVSAGGSAVVAKSNSPGARPSICWFGASSDKTGANVARNTAAINACGSYALSMGTDQGFAQTTVEAPAGYYVISGVQLFGSSYKIVGDGQYATFFVNLSATAVAWAHQPLGGHDVALYNCYQDIQFANWVNRTAVSVPPFQFTSLSRDSFVRCYFGSDDYNFAGPYKGDLVQVTYCSEKAFRDCMFISNGSGVILGAVALTLVDAPQSDSVAFNNCTFFGYALSVAAAVGANNQGIDELTFNSSKMIGVNGADFNGSYDAYCRTTTTEAVTAGSTVTVASATGMVIGRLFVSGQNTFNNAKGGSSGSPQYAFITGINSLTLTLDRNITCASGDKVFSGSAGILLGNIRNIVFNSTQAEGLDAGVVTTGGLGIKHVNCNVGANKGVVSFGPYWNLSYESCESGVSGVPRNSAIFTLLTATDLGNNSQLLRLKGNSFVPGFGPSNPNIFSVVENASANFVPGIIEDWQLNSSVPGVAWGHWFTDSTWVETMRATFANPNKVSFFGATAIAQQAPTITTSTISDAAAKTAINAVIDVINNTGIAAITKA